MPWVKFQARTNFQTGTAAPLSLRTSGAGYLAVSETESQTSEARCRPVACLRFSVPQNCVPVGHLAGCSKPPTRKHTSSSFFGQGVGGVPNRVTFRSNFQLAPRNCIQMAAAGVGRILPKGWWIFCCRSRLFGSPPFRVILTIDLKVYPIEQGV